MQYWVILGWTDPKDFKNGVGFTLRLTELCQTIVETSKTMQKQRNLMLRWYHFITCTQNCSELHTNHFLLARGVIFVKSCQQGRQLPTNKTSQWCKFGQLPPLQSYHFHTTQEVGTWRLSHFLTWKVSPGGLCITTRARLRGQVFLCRGTEKNHASEAERSSFFMPWNWEKVLEQGWEVESYKKANKQTNIPNQHENTSTSGSLTCTT